MTCNDCRTSKSSLTVIIDSFRGIARGFITPGRGEHRLRRHSARLPGLV
jgi:hypothetical protein